MSNGTLFSLKFFSTASELPDLTEREDFGLGLEAQVVGLPNFSRARLLISSNRKSRRFDAGDSVFFDGRAVVDVVTVIVVAL